MENLLVLEPVGGIAGDMFLAAALDLGVDRAALDRALASLGLPGLPLPLRVSSTSRMPWSSVTGLARTITDVSLSCPALSTADTK